MNPVHALSNRIEQGLTGAATARPDAPSAPQLQEPSPAFDVLAQAIADLSAHFLSPIDARVVSAGLPLANGQLPIEQIEPAAARAGLSARIETGRLSKLAAHDLPVLVLPAEAQPYILWTPVGRRRADVVTVTHPGGPPRQVLASNLARSAPVRVARFAPLSDDLAGSAGSDLLGAANAAPAASWLRSGFAGSRRVYTQAILASLAINVLALALPLYTMNVYDRVVPNGAFDTLWALSIGMLIATLFDLLIKTLRAAAVDAASRRADIKLANLVFGRLLGARLPEKAAATGARANTLREFETLREFLNSVTLTTLGDMPFLILFVAMLALVAGPLALVVVAAIPILLGIALLIERALTRTSLSSFRNAAHKNAVVVEALSGLETIKAAGAESWAAGRWERAVAEHVRNGLVIRHLSNLGLHLVGTSTIVVQIIMIVIGCYMVAAGELTSGALVAATMLAGRALAPLSQLAVLITKMHQARLAWRALDEIVRSPQERPDGARLISRANVSGRLAFEDVTYAYEKDAAPALQAVSFSIAPGERVGIIGGIGSGKSTLLKLALALHHPASGRILLDGAAVSQFDPAILRASLGACLQGAELFEGTIRSNIALAEPNAADAAIVEAARVSGALDWISKLPRGFDSPVRERGAGYSRGQRQQMALARALLRNPCCLLLDEPTSDMDIFTETQVVQRLDAATRGKTLLLVTHRPAPLALVDRLIVLEAGRKIADGPKDVVMRSLREAAKGREKAKAPPPAQPAAAPLALEARS